MYDSFFDPKPEAAKAADKFDDRGFGEGGLEEDDSGDEDGSEGTHAESSRSKSIAAGGAQSLLTNPDATELLMHACMCLHFALTAAFTVGQLNDGH